MKKAGLMLLALLLLYGCSNVSEQSDERAKNEGESDMNKPAWQIADEQRNQFREDNREFLLTEEEFLKLVSENEAFFGVTVAEFDDVDVLDFIEDSIIIWWSFDERFFSSSGRLKMVYESYVRNKPSRDLFALRSDKLILVDSTDEEFEEFIAKYLENLGGVLSPIKRDGETATIEGLTVGYIVDFEDGTGNGIVIGRTMHINQIMQENRWKFTEDPVRVSIPTGVDTDINPVIYFSKNGKFFLLLYGIPATVHPVQAFQAIDD